jgi:hypothetical protein
MRWCRARIVERGRGEYNWTTLFQAGVNLETRPSLSAGDFTGPIKVEVGLKKERHVVANRTIDPGELLLVEKPVAVGWPDNSQSIILISSLACFLTQHCRGAQEDVDEGRPQQARRE